MLPQPDGDLLALLERTDIADAELNLSGFSAAAAIDVINHVLLSSVEEPSRRLYIAFEPATEQSGETLFQPVGRRLLSAMRQGIIESCSPVLRDNSAGFIIALSGPESAA